jgi:CheY-like chemotaxis protein
VDREALIEKMQSKDPISILLVDDDPAEYTIWKRMFESFEGPELRLEHVEDIAAAISRVSDGGVDLVFLDNRLSPSQDFRDTAPELRKAGYTGPIGIISSDISGTYFREFREFGVDFRVGKDEIDANMIAFIVVEYTRNQLSEVCAEDLR